MLLGSCNRVYTPIKSEYSHPPLSPNQSADEKTKTIIEPYRVYVETKTQKLIATAADEFTKKGAQSTLGNFVCDALKFKVEEILKSEKIDVVIVNKGGLRTSLPKGEIKVYNIFELMPFENEIVLIEIIGEELQKFIPLFESNVHPFLGFEMILTKNKVLQVLINGETLDTKKVYHLITSDFLLNGGDQFDFLKNNLKVKYTGIKIRDAIIDYCLETTKNQKELIPYKDGRLKISE